MGRSGAVALLECAGACKAVGLAEFGKDLGDTQPPLEHSTPKWFPTGSHKVGATIACLVPRLKPKATWNP
jgi:hypothetical protein